MPPRQCVHAVPPRQCVRACCCSVSLGAQQACSMLFMHGPPWLLIVSNQPTCMRVRACVRKAKQRVLRQQVGSAHARSVSAAALVPLARKGEALLHAVRRPRMLQGIATGRFACLCCKTTVHCGALQPRCTAIPAVRTACLWLGKQEDSASPSRVPCSCCTAAAALGCVQALRASPRGHTLYPTTTWVPNGCCSLRTRCSQLAAAAAAPAGCPRLAWARRGLTPPPGLRT